ncbi:ATP-grasp domain-containing protein [Streptomyces sp. NPDC048324]|uniref:ATP-grasp domain-containing protein n=1 Tax=Streptomyces sp. NPDC048324 TaxID=3157205 RepID=UPI00342AB998
MTGVGANPGFGLSRSLLRLGHQVVAVDAHPLAPGLQLDGVLPHVILRADAPDYSDTMIKLCRNLGVEGIVAGIENDLPPLLELAPRLKGEGVWLWLPDAESVHDCIDKARFHHALARHGIPTPRTWTAEDLDMLPADTPLVVKPRRGHGAQNVHMVTSHRHARLLCELVPAPIVQERVYGTEFTADCLVDRNGRASVILRRRDLVKAGLAAVSTTFEDATARHAVLRTLSAVRAAGLCCVQGFTLEDGSVTITELNVRVAGGFALSEAAGADLIGQMVNGLFGLPVDHNRLTYRTGRFLTHYTETLRVGDAAELARVTASKGAAS